MNILNLFKKKKATSNYGISDYLAKLETYKNLKQKDLDSINDDDDLIIAITTWISSTFDENYTNELQVLSTLNISCRYVYSLDAVVSEVNNGGFN